MPSVFVKPVGTRFYIASNVAKKVAACHGSSEEMDPEHASEVAGFGLGERFHGES